MGKYVITLLCHLPFTGFELTHLALIWLWSSLQSSLLMSQHWVTCLCLPIPFFPCLSSALLQNTILSIPFYLSTKPLVWAQNTCFMHRTFLTFLIFSIQLQFYRVRNFNYAYVPMNANTFTCAQNRGFFIMLLKIFVRDNSVFRLHYE